MTVRAVVLSALLVLSAAAVGVSGVGAAPTPADAAPAPADAAPAPADAAPTPANADAGGTSPAALAPTTITSCRDITSSGVYELGGRIDTSAPSCLNVTASDVVIDGAGNAINMSGTGTGVSVSPSGSYSNVTVRDLTVRNATRGVSVDTDTGATVSDVTVRNVATRDIASDGQAVTFAVSSDAVLRNVRVVGNDLDTVNSFNPTIEFALGSQNLVLENVRVADNVLTPDTGSMAVGPTGDIADNITVRNFTYENNVVDGGFGTTGIDFEAPFFGGSYANVTVERVRFLDNEFRTPTKSPGLRILISGVTNASARDVLVANNTLDTDGGTVEFNGRSTGLDVRNLRIVGNTLDGAGVLVRTDDDGLTMRNASVANNDISGTTDGVGFEVGGDNTVVENATIRNNTIGGDIGDRGIELTIDGADSTYDVAVVGNDVTTDEGLAIDYNLVEARNVNVLVRGNAIRTETTSVTDPAVLLEPSFSNDGPPANGRILFEGNVLRSRVADVSTVEVGDGGTTAGIEFHYNAILGAGPFGIENLNTTAGTFVNATRNYWGAADGPGSNDSDADAPFADPVTGTLADGAGTNVTEGGTAGVSNVHFDPALASAAPDFRVNITDADRKVNAGQNVTVRTRVRNVGVREDTQTITLRVNGSVVDSRPVRLFGNESTTLTLVWETAPGDAGNYTAEVASANDTDSVAVEVNGLPTARNDSYGVVENTTLSVPAPGVLGNDTDADRDSLDVTGAVTRPDNGTLVLDADGSFEYTPDPGFVGTDSFTYAVTDGENATDTATVTVAVDGVPTARNDSYATDEDRNLTVAAPGVLGNDSDPDGDSLSVTGVVSGPGNGTVVIDADGSFEYDPDPDFAGRDSFTYAVTDGNTIDTATVTVAVAADPDPPEARDDAYVGSENRTLTVSAPGVRRNDADPDGDPVSVTGVVDRPDSGTLVLDADGSFEYEPDPGFAGHDSFSYRVTDGNGNTDTATVSLSVAEVNDHPEARDDAYTTEAGTTLVVPSPGVLADDADPNGDSLTASTVEAPDNGTLTLVRDGSFAYTPDPGFVGEDTFTYEARDGTGGTDTATVTVTVRPPGDGDDGGNLTVTVTDTNGPVDAGESLSVAAVVENTGTSERTTDVVLEAGGDHRDGRTVSLGPGESTVVTLTWSTDVGAAGQYEAVVAAGNASDGSAVRVCRVPVQRFDLDDDGTIDASDVLGVVAAYNGGEPLVVCSVSPGDVLDAIALYDGEEP